MNTLVIASAFRSNLNQGENLQRHAQALIKMEEFSISNVQQGIGYYKEEGFDADYESSIIFPIDVNDLSKVATYFLQDMEQDSILLINPNTQEAGLMFKDGSVVTLGKFKAVTKGDALRKGAFTIFQGKHWICK